MAKILTALLAALIVSGCATVKDVDPEKEELARAKRYGKELKIDGEPTPPLVAAGHRDGIEVIVEKSVPYVESELVEREVWHVFVANSTNEAKCVMLFWRLMDFEYITNNPASFLVGPHRQIQAGTMMQKVWTFDNLRVAVPASGYLDKMVVKKADAKAKRGEECSLEDKKVKEK